MLYLHFIESRNSRFFHFLAYFSSAITFENAHFFRNVFAFSKGKNILEQLPRTHFYGIWKSHPFSPQVRSSNEEKNGKLKSRKKSCSWKLFWYILHFSYAPPKWSI